MYLIIVLFQSFCCKILHIILTSHSVCFQRCVHIFRKKDRDGVWIGVGRSEENGEVKDTKSVSEWV